MFPNDRISAVLAIPTPSRAHWFSDHRDGSEADGDFTRALTYDT
jgi:hypothetical protein